ncbi:MAG: type II toxin-antitoxin system HipA family toxin [Rhodothermia bacterium]
MYSTTGLRMLSPKLVELDPLPFTPAELRTEAAERIERMSIAGVQPKVSAWLNASAGRFELKDRGGRFILKPPIIEWPQVPENEDLTMRLASAAGIETPDHGLVYMEGGSLCYVIRRFDRLPRGRKVHVEDFAQLMGLDRDTKYDASMERIVNVIDDHCSFPVLEKEKLFRRVIVAFLLGNEDMHVKNFSLVTTEGRVSKVELSPAYDFVNSTIVLRNPTGEIALPLDGKRSNFRRHHFTEYYGSQRLGLTAAAINHVMSEISAAQEAWRTLIDKSFLTDDLRSRYATVIHERSQTLNML